MIDTFDVRAPDDDDLDITCVKTRNYTFLVYPDSMAANWREKLKEMHIPFLVSPLHTGEKKDGTPLKPHWHVVLCYGGNKTPDQIKRICEMVGGVVPPKLKDFVVQDLSMMCRYLYHADDPDKPQYSPLDVEVYGPIDFESLRRCDKETSNILMDMTYYIFKRKVKSFIKFMMECHSKNPTWFDMAANKKTFYIQAVIKSNREDIEALENCNIAQ